MRLMIVENDALHRSYLRSAAERIIPDYEQILEAENGEAAIELSAGSFPDCVLMDLEMPRLSGVQVAKYFWSKHPGTKILFWSNHANEAYIRGLSKIVPPEAVYGYVLKSEPEETLHNAMRGVFFDNQCVIDRKVRGIQELTSDRNKSLSEIEYEALIDVAQGLTDKAIAVRRNVSPRSVQSRLKQLYQKLGLEKDNLPAGEWGPSLNIRTRIIGVALRRGLITIDALQNGEEKLAQWLEETGQSSL